MFEPKIKNFTKFLRLFCKKSVIGITLCPFGIYVDNQKSISLINHEKIHWNQQLEMLIIPFYIWYFIEWVIKMFFYKNSYINISFEKEAYLNDRNYIYLKSRKHYAWLKLIFKK